MESMEPCCPASLIVPVLLTGQFQALTDPLGMLRDGPRLGPRHPSACSETPLGLVRNTHYAAYFHVNYVEKAQDWTNAVNNTIGFFAEYPKLGKAYLLYNLHLTGFGVISLLILRFSDRTSSSPITYCRCTGLIFAGIVMLLSTFIGYVGMFASKGSTSGLAIMFIPPVALLLAIPAFIIGWLWGRWRIRTEARKRE